MKQNASHYLPTINLSTLQHSTNYCRIDCSVVYFVCLLFYLFICLFIYRSLNLYKTKEKI